MKNTAKCPVGTKIQSVIFSKDNFTEKSAKNWAESNDFKYGKVDEKLSTYRLRQENPSEFKKGSFRTIDLTDGVKAVVACPVYDKKTMRKHKFDNGGGVGKIYKVSAEQYANLIDSPLWSAKKSDIIGNYNIYSESEVDALTRKGNKLLAVWQLPTEKLVLRGNLDNHSMLQWIKDNGIEEFSDGGEAGSDTAVATEILKQLGGMGRLNAMTGAYNFVAHKDGVSFKIKNPSANYIKIILTGMDLYDLEVGRIRGSKYTVVADEKGLYADMLKPSIEKATGLYLTLFEKGGYIGDITEADETATDKNVAIRHFEEQVSKGETMGVIQMYEDAARNAGATVGEIEEARKNAKSKMENGGEAIGDTSVETENKNIGLPDSENGVDKIYTEFFKTKVMEDWFGDLLQVFWKEKKANLDDEYVSRLRAEGFSDKNIFAILFGYLAVAEIKCDREFGMNGVLGKRKESQGGLIDSIIGAKKAGYYMAGFKYQQTAPELIDGFFKKYRISETPLVFEADVKGGIGDERVVIYKGDGIYIGRTVNREYNQNIPLSIFDAVNKGYLGMVADSPEKLYDAIQIMFDTEEAYIKTLNMFYNSLGGIDANDIVSAFGVAQKKTGIKIDETFKEAVGKFPSTMEKLEDVNVEKPLEETPKNEIISQIEEAIAYLQQEADAGDAESKEALEYLRGELGLSEMQETDLVESKKHAQLNSLNNPEKITAFIYRPTGDYVSAEINQAFQAHYSDTNTSGKPKLESLELWQDNFGGIVKVKTWKGSNVGALFSNDVEIENGVQAFEQGAEVLIGGKADGMSLDDIALMHGVLFSHIMRQAKIGMAVEREHTSDDNLVIEIVKDHLYENPSYYTALQKIESSFEIGGAVGGWWIEVPSELRNKFILMGLMEIRGMTQNGGTEMPNGVWRFTFDNEIDLDKAIVMLNKLQNPNYRKDMPNNLSELKKYLKVGVLLKVSYNRNVPNAIGKTRVVVLTQTNGIYLMDGTEVPVDTGKKSWLPYPKESDMAFTPFGFTVYATDPRKPKVKIRLLQYDYLIGEQERVARNVEAAGHELSDNTTKGEAVMMGEFVDRVQRLADSVEFFHGGSLKPEMFNNRLDFNLDVESVSCFIKAKNTGRMLILRRTGNDYGGTWSLLSGGVEKGEDYEKTIKREIQEELGVNLINDLIFITATKHPERTHYYYEMIVDEEFEPTLNPENDAYMWINMGELPSDTHPLLKKFIKCEIFA